MRLAVAVAVGVLLTASIDTAAEPDPQDPTLPPPVDSVVGGGVHDVAMMLGRINVAYHETGWEVEEATWRLGTGVSGVVGWLVWTHQTGREEAQATGAALIQAAEDGAIEAVPHVAAGAAIAMCAPIAGLQSVPVVVVAAGWSAFAGFDGPAETQAIKRAFEAAPTAMNLSFPDHLGDLTCVVLAAGGAVMVLVGVVITDAAESTDLQV